MIFFCSSLIDYWRLKFKQRKILGEQNLLTRFTLFCFVFKIFYFFKKKTFSLFQTYVHIYITRKYFCCCKNQFKLIMFMHVMYMFLVVVFLLSDLSRKMIKFLVSYFTINMHGSLVKQEIHVWYIWIDSHIDNIIFHIHHSMNESTNYDNE